MFPVARFLLTSAFVFYGLAGLKNHLEFELVEKEKTEKLKKLQQELEKLQPSA